MEDRIRKLNDAAIRSHAQYVLYWMQMNRRAPSNHALAYAAELANEHHLPLLVYEGLTYTYPFANDRFHTFLLEGIADTQQRLRALGIGYIFYLRRRRDDPDDLLYRLAREAAAVVTDDYPTFIARRHNASVPGKIDCPYYVVDASCVVPMNRLEKREWAAYTIRPKIHKLLPRYLKPAPEVRVAHAFTLPVSPFHTPVTAGAIAQLTASCEIDHTVAPSLSFRGGYPEAARRLEHFVNENLRRYTNEKNEPSSHVTSDLSPYLHFGHISALETALAVRDAARERRLMADSFLEELIVRRELAFNFARFTGDLESLDAVPTWARKTLESHDADPRPHIYTREQLERGETYDALWNATQKELLLRGKIHGYYRMYWGKKIIEWSPTHAEALASMIYLHDRYALDGRDPNTYTNVLWCFGLHDRPFAERPIFGQVRYMSQDGMKRKTDTAAYIREVEFMERSGKDPFRLE